MDTQKSVLTYIYNLLTTDATLITAMTTVRLYLTWAISDAEFPYMVHRMDFRAGTIFPARIGTYYLDIWDDADNSETLLTIRQRIIGLLDQINFNTTDVKNVRLSLAADSFIPEDEPGIWHYAMQFDIYIWRQAELIAINSR